ncbi:phage holin family protein [Bacillus niameyensis]|uniref:phage holin family protein n=1 Tax=Bacillus niameyensis TaxID=1522308 RepID=UPI000783E155|nr:phage holin family protein [Bacillus niameyensis]
MENILKFIVAFFGAAASFLFGGWSPLIQILVVFNVIDYVMGVTVAAYLGQLSSKIGFKGIARKVLILLLVAVAHAIDTIMGDNHFIRDAVIFFYLANELLSILETVGKTNLPIPDVLKKAVETLNKKGSNE